MAHQNGPLPSQTERNEVAVLASVPEESAEPVRTELRRVTTEDMPLGTGRPRSRRHPRAPSTEAPPWMLRRTEASNDARCSKPDHPARKASSGRLRAPARLDEGTDLMGVVPVDSTAETAESATARRAARRSNLTRRGAGRSSVGAPPARPGRARATAAPGSSRPAAGRRPRATVARRPGGSVRET